MTGEKVRQRANDAEGRSIRRDAPNAAAETRSTAPRSALCSWAASRLRTADGAAGFRSRTVGFQKAGGHSRVAP